MMPHEELYAFMTMLIAFVALIYRIAKKVTAPVPTVRQLLLVTQPRG